MYLHSPSWIGHLGNLRLLKKLPQNSARWLWHATEGLGCYQGLNEIERHKQKIIYQSILKTIEYFQCVKILI